MFSSSRCNLVAQRPVSGVLWTLGEVGGCGGTFVFAAAVGSMWRATPQAGQRVSCWWLSLYGPSGWRQLQCQGVGFAFIRRFGWTFELNMTRTGASSGGVFGDRRDRCLAVRVCGELFLEAFERV
jgi:hypothetical protein